jgi:hypothetical protein
MSTRYNWWVEIENVNEEFIMAVEDILGTVESKDKTGCAFGTPNIVNGINDGMLAVWIKANPGGVMKTKGE